MTRIRTTGTTAQEANVLITGFNPVEVHGLSSIVAKVLTTARIEVEATLEGAVKACTGKSYLLVLVDPGVRGPGGLQALLACTGKAKTVVLGGDAAHRHWPMMYRLGIAGLLHKREGIGEIERALRKVLGEGGYYISDELLTVLLLGGSVPATGTHARNGAAPGGGGRPHVKGKLTKREMEVAEMLAHGKKNIQICNELALKASTVSTIKAKAMHKMGVANLVELGLAMRGQDQG